MVEDRYKMSPVYRKGIVHLPNGGDFPVICLCDSGAIVANYISPNLVRKLTDLNDEELPIRPAPKGAFARLADGVTICPVEGIVNLAVTITDGELRPHQAILDFDILSVDEKVDLFIGFPTLCTVLKKLFLQTINEGELLYTDNWPIDHFEKVVNAVNLLPPAYDSEEYEIRYPFVWANNTDDNIAEEERQIMEEYLAEPSISFIASRTFTEHKEEFMRTYDTQIFPAEHRKGMPNVPIEVIEFKQWLEEEGWRAFQPTTQGWQGIKGVEITLEWKEPLPRSMPCNPRPIPNRLKDKFDTYLENMTRYFLVRSDSLVVTPILCVRKPPDGIRVVGMYNLTVNKFLALTTYPIPNPRECVQKCAGSLWFGNGDITRAFHQLMLTLESSKALTIATTKGNFRPVAIPEGVVCGSHYLQEVMTRIMQGSEEFNIVLFDNLFFFGKTLRQFLENFKWVLQKSIEYRVIWNLSKTAYSQREILFGLAITPKGYSIAKERYQGILDLGFPSNVREARSCLGVLGFTSEFCPKYAEYAFYIFEMTKKEFNWSPDSWKVDYRSVFERLKLACTAGLVELGFPDYSLKWISYTDASSKAACAVIVQIDERGRQIPLAVYSKKFSEKAQEWPVIQQEAFSFGLLYTKGRTLLLGKPHELMTDHENLLKIEKSERLMIRGIVQKMQQFQIERVLHIPGSRNPADHATRAPILNAVSSFLRDDDEYHVPAIFSPCDARISAILCKSWRKQGWSSSRCSDALQMLYLASSPIYHKDTYTENDLTAYQESAAMVAALQGEDIEIALREVHNSARGHFGLAKTRAALDRDYPDHEITDSQISTFLLGCHICQKHAARAAPAVIPLNKTHNRFPDDIVKAFRHIVSVDFVKLPKTSRGNIGASVFLNHFSRRFRWYAQTDNTSRELSKSFLKYYSVHGSFHHVLSDQGRDLMGECFRYMREYLGRPNHLFVHMTSIPYRPQGHGTEPTIKKIINRLRDLINEPHFDMEWDDDITMAIIEIIINFSRNIETGAIPIAVDTGDPDLYFEVPTSSELPNEKTAEYASMVHDRMQQIRNILANNHAQLHAKKTAINSPSRNRRLSPGSYVLHRDHKLDNKLRLPREGPYVVVRHEPDTNEVYVKDLITGATDIRVHCENLTLFVVSAEDALEAAKLDNKQCSVSSIVGYKGDPLLRTSCSFLVEFISKNQEPELIWKNWDLELDQLVAFEDFCRSRSELILLLRNAQSARQQLAQMRKYKINIDEGIICYYDLRSWGHAWYNEINLPNHFVTRYMVKGIYGKTGIYRGIQRIDINFPSMFENYIGSAGMDAVGVQLWGMNFIWKPDWILIDDKFVYNHPFLLNEFYRASQLRILETRIQHAANEVSSMHELVQHAEHKHSI